jgi:hypothetical protein
MAWLYVPGGEGWNLGSPSPSETPTAPSVLSNGKSMPPASWSRAWKKGGYIRLLSGTTLRPSTADAGVDAWISSLRDSPVSPSAQPGSARPTTIADTSGRMSGGLSTGRDRLSSFWRTSQPLFPPDRQMGDPLIWWSEQSWKDWVTELRRRSSAHRMWGHHISGSGSLSWPTIAARDYRTPNRNGNQVDQLPNFVDQWATPVTVTGGPAGQGPNGTSRDRDLQREAAQWASPTQHDGRRPGSDATSTQGANLKRDAEQWATPQAGNSKGGGVTQARDLARESRFWQTPGTDSFRSRGGDRKHEMGLDQEARAQAWPTPSVLQQEESVESWTARRAREKAKGRNGNGFGEPLDMLAQRFHLDPETNGPGPPSSQSAPNSHRRLNPLFVEWLMGWPEHWSTARSDSDSSATAWCHWLRRSRSALARMHSALR